MAVGLTVLNLSFLQQNGRFNYKLLVLPDKSYYLIFLTFFVRGVNLESLVIVTAKENSEP